MAELSKTARASMGKQIKEVHVETTEEAIKAVRVNREAGLFVGDMSRVDKLLVALDEESQKLLNVSSAYDALKAENERIKETNQNLEGMIVHFQDEIRELKTQAMEYAWADTLEEGKTYRVTRVHDEISVEPVVHYRVALLPESPAEKLKTQEEMENFLPIFKELIKNPEFLRGIEAAGYKLDFAQFISDFAVAAGWKGSPIIEQMITPEPEVLKLGPEATKVFVDALLNPPSPTIVMAEIPAQEHDEHHKHEVIGGTVQRGVHTYD